MEKCRGRNCSWVVSCSPELGGVSRAGRPRSRYSSSHDTCIIPDILRTPVVFIFMVFSLQVLSHKRIYNDIEL